MKSFLRFSSLLVRSPTAKLLHVVRMGSEAKFDIELKLKSLETKCLPCFRATPSGTYEDAVSALNGLQSNAAAIEKSRRERSINAHKSISNTVIFLQRIGVQVLDLDRLNIIHVAGTKGKGSTCAFVESILRHSGMKTGLYTSPHLVAVRERICINGQPLSKEKFTQYFWEVFRKLEEAKNVFDPEDPGMPQYFMFLTVMAFHVFLQEKVDVAILEVGIGGTYDCTNIIRSPVVVGVTSLGLDHVGLLGDTIDKIAYQKAGIFKPGVPAFTVPQSDLALNVLKERAAQLRCPLYIIPEFDAYKWQRKPVVLGVPGDAQRQNASLALQLCHSWLATMKPEEYGHQIRHSMQLGTVSEAFEVSPMFRAGLSHCFWPGRCQMLQKGTVTYFLDGAHTPEGMEHCVQWFKSVNSNMGNNYRKMNECHVLLFNCTGDRKPDALLPYLVDIPFDFAIFCPNRIYSIKDVASDQSNFTIDTEKELKQCENNKQVWCSLKQMKYSSNIGDVMSSQVSYDLYGSEIKDTYAKFTCLLHAVQWITQGQIPPYKRELLPKDFPPLPPAIMLAKKMKILVTGSLHLVGGVLSLIDPELSSRNSLLPSTESLGS